MVRAVNMNITHVMCAFLTKAVQGSGIRPQVSLSCQETYPLPDVSHVFSKHCTPPFPFVNTNGLSCCAAPTTKAFVKMEYRCRHGILGWLQSSSADSSQCYKVSTATMLMFKWAYKVVNWIWLHAVIIFLSGPTTDGWSNHSSKQHICMNLNWELHVTHILNYVNVNNSYIDK